MSEGSPLSITAGLSNLSIGGSKSPGSAGSVIDVGKKLLEPFREDEWNTNSEGNKFDPSKVYPARFPGLVSKAANYFVVCNGAGRFSLTERAKIKSVEMLMDVLVEPGPIRDITTSVNAKRSTGSREYAFSYPNPNGPDLAPVEFSTNLVICNCIISYSPSAGKRIVRQSAGGQFTSVYLGTYINLGIPTDIATRLIQEVEQCEGRCGLTTKMNSSPVVDSGYTWLVSKVVAKEGQEFVLNYVGIQGGQAMSRKLANSSTVMLDNKKSFKGLASITFRVSYPLNPGPSLAGTGTISPVLVAFQLEDYTDIMKPTSVTSTETVFASSAVHESIWNNLNSYSTPAPTAGSTTSSGYGTSSQSGPTTSADFGNTSMFKSIVPKAEENNANESESKSEGALLAQKMFKS